MAGGAIVGALRYLVEVDSERAAMEVDKFLAEAQAKVEAAGGDATFRLLAESAQLDRKLAEADAEVDRLKAKKAEVKIGADSSELDRAIVAAEAEVKALSRERVDIKMKTSGAVQALAELKAVQAIKNDLTQSTIRDTAATDKNALAVARLKENYNRLASERLKLERIKPAVRRTEGENLAIARMAAQMRVMENEAHRLGADLSGITKDVEGADSGFRNWARSIGSTRANIGPFSTTIRGLMTILPALTPILFSLAGAASALVGSIGAGLVGAFGVASGAAAGFGLAIGPLLPSLKQLFTEAKAAPSIGGALKQMKDSLTGGIRPHFMQDAHAAITTLKADFPTFQKAADGAFKSVSAGFQGWMRGLRTPEAQHILSNLIGNFSKDIGPVMAGLGSLGTAFGRFISIASNSGPGIARTFQNWAQGIEQGTRAGTGFGARVQNLISQAKTLGSAITATGRLLTTFFSAGASSGQDLLQSLTRSENRMTAWMHTVAGQRSLHQFFADAVTNTKQLFSALAPLIATFTHLGNALAPVTTGALKAATFLGNIVHTVAEFVPARISLQAFGATLAGIFVLSKFSAGIAAIKTFLASIGLMAAEQSAETAAVAANTAALEANTAARLGVAGAAGAEEAAVAGSAAAMDASAAGAVGAGAAAGDAAGAFTLFGLSAGATIGIAAALTGGLIYLVASTKRNADHMQVFNGTLQRFRNDSAAAMASAQQLKDAQAAGAKATQSGNQAFRTMNKLQQQGKQDSKQFAAAGENLAKSLNAQHDANVKANQAAQQHQQDLRNQVHDVNSLQRQYDALNKRIEAGGKKGPGGLRSGVSQEDLKNLQQFSQGLTVARLNLQRMRQGQSILPQSSIGAINQLKAAAGNKIAMKFELQGTPAALTALGRLSQQATQLVGRKKVMHILADARTPAQALQRLNAIRLHDKTLRARLHDEVSSRLGTIRSRVQALKDKLVHVKAQDAASPKVGQIQQKIQALKDKAVHLRALDNATSSIHAVQSALAALHDKTVTVTVNTVHHGHARGGIEGFASGGVAEWMWARAIQLAAARPGLDPKAGARVSSPRYVVGEEPGRTEFIITDNPAYRRDNLSFLREAARALGQAVVPGYGKGGKHHHGGGGKGGGGGATNLDDATASDSAYAYWEDIVQRDAALADLAKNNYDAGTPGYSITSVTSAIEKEINDYRTLAGIIAGMGIAGDGRQNPGPKPVPVPPAPKGKHANSAAGKKQKAAHDKAQAINDSIKNNAEQLGNELWTINNVTIPGLQLDELQAQSAANTNTILGQETANLARYNAFSQFASNIVPTEAAAIPMGGIGPAQSFAGPSPYFASPSAPSSSAPASAPTAPSGATTINLEQNFAAPPPDPHTWAQNTVFEISAAGA